MSLDHFNQLSPEQQEMVLNGPALEPPPGVTSNLEHPPNRNDLAQITNALCLTATCLVALLRVYAKVFCIKKVHMEDYIALAALGTYLGCIYCNYWSISVCGVFVHQWNVRVRDLFEVLYIFHIGANLAEVTIMAIKASILLEWTRIFLPHGNRNAFFWTCRVVLWVHTLFHASWIIAENLSCAPHEKIWNQAKPGHCVKIKALYLPTTILNLVADVIILVLPQKIIWTLQISRKNKIGISLIFTIGLLACISASFRLGVTVQFYLTDDTAYAKSAVYLWALAEMTCLFLVFCVPAAPRALIDSGLAAKVALSLNAAYRKVNQTGSSLFGIPSSPSTPASETVAAAKQDQSRRMEGGILCTTHISVREDFVGSGERKGGEGGQYCPWIELR
ncbi:hypothetical protein F4778DRAFT_500096 [Xylariomycetidae sp. FL2044]|nr:hypothetical protein F4778DRAFT_500096 [Xylariomycetidae sp. FL2044]